MVETCSKKKADEKMSNSERKIGRNLLEKESR